MTSALAHRDTIFVEDGVAMDQRSYPGNQFVLRLHAPRCASNAQPGNFAHLTCDPAVPMRRPLSIMRATNSRSSRLRRENSRSVSGVRIMPVTGRIR